MNPSINTVLIVEDDDDLRVALRDVLLHERYQVLEANDGLQAMNMLRGLPPEVSCLVLLDLKLPVVSGLQFLEELRQLSRCSRFPVIAMSASELLEDVRRLPCVAGTLRKPFDEDLLTRLVRDETRAIGRPHFSGDTARRG